MRRPAILLGILILSGVMAGCAALHSNPPLAKVGSAEAYSFNNVMRREGGVGDNLMTVSLSGGGARAGALAYGVLQQLERVKLPEGGSLLDEVKIISSVSGGSFASAYYGLYGKQKFFESYKKEVLYRKLNARILVALFRFVNWVPIAFSADLGRSDIAQNLYDEYFYNHHTIQDFPRKWPFIIINATDMSKGTTLSFIQEDFDKLCSDVNGIKIARAVVSSSAFPGPFTPLTFRNYAKSSCGYTAPAWVDQALAAPPENNLERFVWAQNIKSYSDVKRRPFIHVMDGGVADNLGLRPILDHFRMGNWDVLDEQKRFKSKRVIMIAVDAKPAESGAHDLKAKIPKLMSVMVNAATLPMTNYSVKTVQEFALRMQENQAAEQNYETMKKMCDQIHSSEAERQACYDQFQAPFGGIQKPPYPGMYLIHVQFDAVKDPAVREKVSGIGTSLQLPKSDIDLLEKTGGNFFWSRLLFKG